jgi:hypothetical protein
MLRLMGCEEEFELLIQALAVTRLENCKESLLERYSPAFRADKEMFHQFVGILCLQGGLFLEETDARFEESIVQFYFCRRIFLAIRLPLLRLAQSLDQLFHQSVLSLCL